jgi:flagellar protein FliS
MSLNKAVYQYQQSSVFTATPEELTLMLYNGCIKAIRLAEVTVEEKNYEKANYYICKAEAIIRELRNTLDMKYEISENLYNLYTYFLNRLIEANVKKDKNILEEVLHFVEEIRDTWSQAMKQARIENSQNQSGYSAQNV